MLVLIFALVIIFFMKSSAGWPIDILKGHWQSRSSDIYFSISGVWTVQDGKAQLLNYEILNTDKENSRFELSVTTPPFSDNVVSTVKMSDNGKEMTMTTFSKTPLGEMSLSNTYKKIDEETEPPSDDKTNALKQGFADIHSLAMSGSLNDVKEVVEKGADINLKDSLGFTALHYACRDGKTEIVSYLLEQKADPNVRSYSVEISPLYFAIREGDQYPEIVSLLLKHGADVNIRSRDGNTPLHLAAYSDEMIEIVKILLDSGADPKILNKRQKSPLDIANEINQTEIASILKKALQME
jgi:ankyrin repeat protein